MNGYTVSIPARNLESLSSLPAPSTTMLKPIKVSFNHLINVYVCIHMNTFIRIHTHIQTYSRRLVTCFCLCMYMYKHTHTHKKKNSQYTHTYVQLILIIMKFQFYRYSDISGCPILRPFKEVRWILEQRQTFGCSILCETRAEHRLWRRLCETLRLLIGSDRHARRIAL